MSFSYSIGWFRFTVQKSSVDEVVKQIGGDWLRMEKGFQGYMEGWISQGEHGGLGRIGTGCKWSVGEVHVDLSQEWIGSWTFEKLQQVANWVVREKDGHFSRIDAALDDKSGLVDVQHVYDAVKAGHCVTRFRQSRLIDGLNLETGEDTGKTLTMGSRQSDTFLRLYDKTSEQRAKGKEVEGPWYRWELEFKDERATAVALMLASITEEQFRRWLVGLLRSTVDFRDCTRADDPMDRYYAPVLSWWEKLTEGMERARLQLQKMERKIEDVKKWVTEAVAPSLAVICGYEEDGERWLVRTITEGVERWRSKHLALLKGRKEARARLSRLRPSSGLCVRPVLVGR